MKRPFGAALGVAVTGLIARPRLRCACPAAVCGRGMLASVRARLDADVLLGLLPIRVVLVLLLLGSLVTSSVAVPLLPPLNAQTGESLKEIHQMLVLVICIVVDDSRRIELRWLRILDDIEAPRGLLRQQLLDEAILQHIVLVVLLVVALLQLELHERPRRLLSVDIFLEVSPVLVLGVVPEPRKSLGGPVGASTALAIRILDVGFDSFSVLPKAFPAEACRCLPQLVPILALIIVVEGTRF
mmetsp:Transcript_24283/g.43048  ORF Transcript_24283/g.43048 Transcript_24283/m.43048 type:complete len:242 (+) Transcript_24283:6701-7426(+)